jgi:hypothetical protein
LVILGMCVWVYVSACVCVYIYMVYVYIHIIHIHTYVYAYMYIGSHVVSQYRLREGVLPPPPDGSEPPPPESRPEKLLRLPHVASAVAMDASTALLFTGMSNGGCVLWNNVFGTSLFALRRHRAAVTAAAFTLYETQFVAPLLVTAGADAVIQVTARTGH